MVSPRLECVVFIIFDIGWLVLFRKSKEGEEKMSTFVVENGVFIIYPLLNPLFVVVTIAVVGATILIIGNTISQLIRK